MIKFVTIATLITLILNSAVAQSRKAIDSLLLPLYDISNSKDITKAPQAKQIIDYGGNVIALLASNFTDTTLTNVKSDCQNTYLKKGEIAIILADRIEIMPYMTLTGIQNCMFEYCEDNPNLIEYYITAIRRNSVELFKEKYLNWLTSKERKKWPGLVNIKKNKRKNVSKTTATNH